MLKWLCRNAAERPVAWFVTTALATVPALVLLGSLELDTNLIRLLPRHSRASMATRTLEPVIGGDSYFAVIVEGDDTEQLLSAVRETAARVAAIDGVRSVEYHNPVGFIERYLYLLVPSYYLELLTDMVFDWQAEVNPFLDDLGGDEDAEESYGEAQDRKDIEDQLQLYTDLPEFHQSSDGRFRGMLVRPARGTTSLGEARKLFQRLEQVAAEIAQEYDVETDVSGSLRNKVDEFDVILGDLNRSGTFAGIAIVLVLLVSFRSITVLPVLLYPLAVGLVWAFATVPNTVGALNTISVFLALVLFGMGIDYSIHIVKRFQAELSHLEPAEALRETYLSTGSSVIVSGVTTTLSLGILAWSDFRGFSDFGIIGGISILMVLLAMVTVMPATLVLGHRFGLVKPVAHRDLGTRPAGRGVTVLLGGLVVVAAAFAVVGLAFDYDFGKLKADIPNSAAAKERLRQVYPTSRTPGAIYVAADLESLDEALAVVEARRGTSGSTIGRVTSIRDFAPTRRQTHERLELIDGIREETRGSWTRRIEDEEKQGWIDDLQAWQPPPAAAGVDDVVEILRSSLEANDGSGEWLLGVYPNVPRSDGKNAMAFTTELYELQMPEGVRGPAGETPVFGELLFLVIAEGPWLVGLTFLGIFLMVAVYYRSVKDALWILLPLGSGLVITLGIMAATGVKLNFFNIVVIPALLGMGVDHGVHYYGRWKELQRNTVVAHAELLAPLSICTVTTMIGYAGMILANHQGLRSIGIVACIGLASIWATSLILMPGLLGWRDRTDR